MKNQTDLYQRVTDTIIDMIENNEADGWVRWRKIGTALPSNFATGTVYSGINVLLLWCAANQYGYPTSQWLTFKQALAQGACVRKGEKGVTCIYYNTVERESADGEETVTIPFARSFTLFNVAQIDGLKVPATPEVAPVETVAHVDAAINATHATIHHGFDKAYYKRSTDSIHLPSVECFASMHEYYMVALHELTHWTGAPHRLNREYGKRHGDNAYAFEELVAELGSAFLSAELGLEERPVPFHASYVKHWLEVLKKDKRAIVTAASHSKAHRYIMEFSRPSTALEVAA